MLFRKSKFLLTERKFACAIEGICISKYKNKGVGKWIFATALIKHVINFINRLRIL